MKTILTWDERKRLANLAKHGLDFAHAECVLDSRYRLDIPATRGSEARVHMYRTYAKAFQQGQAPKTVHFKYGEALERRWGVFA